MTTVWDELARMSATTDIGQSEWSGGVDGSTYDSEVYDEDAGTTDPEEFSAGEAPTHDQSGTGSGVQKGVYNPQKASKRDVRLASVSSRSAEFKNFRDWLVSSYPKMTARVALAQFDNYAIDYEIGNSISLNKHAVKEELRRVAGLPTKRATRRRLSNPNPKTSRKASRKTANMVESWDVDWDIKGDPYSDRDFGYVTGFVPLGGDPVGIGGEINIYLNDGEYEVEVIDAETNKSAIAGYSETFEEAQDIGAAAFGIRTNQSGTTTVIRDVNKTSKKSKELKKRATGGPEAWTNRDPEAWADYINLIPHFVEDEGQAKKLIDEAMLQVIRLGLAEEVASLLVPEFSNRRSRARKR